MRTARLALAAAVLVALCMGCSTAAKAPAADSPADATAQTAPAAAQVELLLKTGTTILDEPVVYPQETPAQVTAAIVTLPPGASTGWHTHGVPLMGYMIAGELTVEYRGHGKRVYRPGDTFMEAIAIPHDGHNYGDVPVRILAAYMGAEGLPTSRKAE